MTIQDKISTFEFDSVVVVVSACGQVHGAFVVVVVKIVVIFDASVVLFELGVEFLVTVVESVEFEFTVVLFVTSTERFVESTLELVVRVVEMTDDVDVAPIMKERTRSTFLVCK